MRTRSTPALIAALALAAAAASCTNDDDTAGTTGPTTTTTSPGTTTSPPPTTPPTTPTTPPTTFAPDVPDERMEVVCPDEEPGRVTGDGEGDVVIPAPDDQAAVVDALTSDDGAVYGNAGQPCDGGFPACYELADTTQVLIVYPALVGRDPDDPEYQEQLAAIRDDPEYQQALANLGVEGQEVEVPTGDEEQPTVAGVASIALAARTGSRDDVARQLLTDVLPTTRDVANLEDPAWIFDLVYVNALAPNNGFHPWDDPSDFAAARGEQAAREAARPAPNQIEVAVVDSPMPSDVAYVNATFTSVGAPAPYLHNGRYRQVAGHGPFVAQMIEDLSGADVTLTSIDQYVQIPGSADVVARSPLLFTDLELVGTVTRALVSDPAVLNLSLGRPRCSGSTEDGAAIAAFLDVLAGAKGTVVVAAAGNDGHDLPHFPAAAGATPFRRSTATNRIVAVGSTSQDAAGTVRRDCFSNFGSWVTAWAPGFRQAGIFPDPQQAARWSGTSFAAPQFTAAVVREMVATASPAAGAASSLIGVTTPPSDPDPAGPPVCS